MKRIVLLAGLFLLSSVPLFAQNITLSRSDLEDQLCRRWTADYLIIEGEKVMPEENAAPIIVMFQKDGTIDHLKTNPDDPDVESSWEYSTREKLVNIYEGRTLSGQILSISEKEMIVKMMPSPAQD